MPTKRSDRFAPSHLQQRGGYQDLLNTLQVQLNLRRVDVVQDFFHGHEGNSVDWDLVLLHLPEASSKHAPGGEKCNELPSDCPVMMMMMMRAHITI